MFDGLDAIVSNFPKKPKTFFLLVYASKKKICLQAWARCAKNCPMFPRKKYVCADNGLYAIVSNLPKKPKTLFFIGLCFQEKKHVCRHGQIVSKIVVKTGKF